MNDIVEQVLAIYVFDGDKHLIGKETIRRFLSASLIELMAKENKMKQYKSKRKEESQIIWSNMTNDHQFNPFKKYYAFAQIEGKQVVLDYVGKFRSEALVALEEIARLEGGKLVSGVHVFK